MSTFARLAPRLQQAIVSRLGWTALRPVQDLAGAAILDGENAVVLAPTAGGKTEAAMFPVLSALVQQPCPGVGAIYVAPIKALLNNQEQRLGTYTEMVGLRRFVWHGDVTAAPKRRFIDEPAELLMTTPESLEVMLLSKRVPVPKLFSDLRFVVVDEIHAVAGTDRGTHLMSVIERLARHTANDVQRIGLSATVGNPDVILRWLQGYSRRPGRVVDPPKPKSQRELLVTVGESVADLAKSAAKTGAGRKSLFFCQSRAFTECVADQMRASGIDVFVHHSSVSLEERRIAEERFHRGTNACIVCTSTLELGIDVGDLDLVFQANAPSSVSSFLQRMGRTGRREGQRANTTFLCDNTDSVLQAIALIELAREGWVESVAVQTRSWPVLVHQVLAMALEHGGVRTDDAWNQLSRVSDFSGISRQEFDVLVAHLLRRDYVTEAGGRLLFGAGAEWTYGRKYFMEMYAVFSSPVMYVVRTVAGQEIGSIEQDFADRLVENMTSFLLGGRAWTVERINHKERFVQVKAAPRGTNPTWGGYIPQMLGYALCRRIHRILIEDVAYPYVHATAAEMFEERRRELQLSLRRPGRTIVHEGAMARWWTFAGGCGSASGGRRGQCRCAAAIGPSCIGRVHPGRA